MKFPKLYLVCDAWELRPQFGYVKVDKDFTIATNARIIVKHKTSELFKDDFVSLLPENGIMIHANAVKLICRQSTVNILLSDDKNYIQLYQKDTSMISYNCQPGLSFPGTNKLFPELDKCQPLKEIALSANLLFNLAEGMGIRTKILHLYFYGPTKAILIKANNPDEYFSAIGLIMPVMMNY